MWSSILDSFQVLQPFAWYIFFQVFDTCSGVGTCIGLADHCQQEGIGHGKPPAFHHWKCNISAGYSLILILALWLARSVQGYYDLLLPAVAWLQRTLLIIPKTLAAEPLILGTLDSWYWDPAVRADLHPFNYQQDQGPLNFQEKTPCLRVWLTPKMGWFIQC